MGFRKSPKQKLGARRSIPPWVLLPDSDDDVCSSREQSRRATVHYFRIARSAALRALPGIRVASDLVAPPAKPRELLDFKPASWEMPE